MKLPRKYAQMKRSKLGELALAGDEYARKALLMHQELDKLIDSVAHIQTAVEREMR